jgi:flagellar M-ring protein FliF
MASLGNILGSRQMVMLVGLSLSIAIGVTAAFWLREPSYELLYSNLSDRDVGAVMDALRADSTPYRLKNGALMVPSADVYATRLRLSSQGLPRGAGFGLEIIEGESSFSTSQFMENARYHHALETELGRTISFLQPVQSARVHLALPKPTVFLRKSNKPSASVFLDLFPGRVLEGPQVNSIVHLVASSIPELESSHVTVVDQRGTLLNSPDADDTAALSGREFAYVERVQNAYQERIVNLLTPMMGPGRVKATVNADIDFTAREETREFYDPANSAVRSEQLSEDTQRGGANPGQGIPGALSNQPPVAAPGANVAGATGQAAETSAQASSPTRVSLQTTRNFEVDRQLSHTKEPANSLRRLSVAVLIDDISDVDEKGKPLTRSLEAAELTEIENLVRGAVGFSEARGDTISITNVSFYEGPSVAPPEAPGFFSQPLVRDILTQLPAVALLLVVALGVIRPIVIALSKGGGIGSIGSASGGQSLPTATGRAPAATAPPAPLTFDDKVNVAKQLASNDPERVAQVVRAWVQDSKG